MVSYCWELASLMFPKDGRVSERDRETEMDGQTKRGETRKERDRESVGRGTEGTLCTGACEKPVLLI